MKKSVYTMCGMCTVRCPVRVEVENNQVTWIEGNMHLLKGAICGKGSAAVALIKDKERPQQPLIRAKGRGAGQWHKVSWTEAYDYIAEKLSNIKKEYGAESVVVSSRGGPWQNIYKTFCHAFGSPNYTNHDCTCGRNTHHASLSINGVGRKGFVYDMKNCKHLVLFGRDIFGGLKIAENLQILDMLDNGGRLTYIDVRQNITATKASRFFQVRPGTDYALALAMIHEIIKNDAYDHDFINKYSTGFSELCSFVEEYDAKWAAKECGIKVKSIMDFIQEISADRPKVIFHPGWNLARYEDSFYASRALHTLNILMGNIENEGGLIFPKGAADCGKENIRTYDCPRPDITRADGVGWKYKHFDAGPGLAHLFFPAMTRQTPYPIKAWIAMRHDPLSGFPDPETQKQAFDHCDLLVSIDTNYSEFGWFSDVILPESTFLERDTPICLQKGPKPRLIMRKKAVEPQYDTKAGWEIFRQLAIRLGIEEYFPHKTIEEIWNWQLEPTGFTVADFEEKGFVELTDSPIMFDRDRLEGKFKTPSGKVEFISQKLNEAGLESYIPYQSPAKPKKGQFRLIYGRCAVHTHGHTINNPLLYELMPENSLWINSKVAAKLGINNGELVDVIAANGFKQRGKAHVTDFIHPECVYTTHGFGKQIPRQTRSYHAGISDQKLMVGLLDKWDKAGGGVALCEAFVTVRKSTRNMVGKVEL